MDKLCRFSERLAEKMLERGLTQTQMSEIFKTTQQTISNWVKGVHEPDLNTFLKICLFFNEEPNYMLAYDELKNKSM